MMSNFDGLLDAVRTNCHISDAQHGRDLTLCTYLLEMRELYRWERGISLGAPVPQAEVGTWMTQREALWSSLEDAAHVPLPLGASTIDPFDVERANRALVGQRLVYGAGIGRFGKPQFFLGALEREEWRDGVRVLVAGREYARDLSAAPAASRERHDLRAAGIVAALALGARRSVDGQARRRRAQVGARQLRIRRLAGHRHREP